MNARVAKKIRREARRNWNEYVVFLASLPLKNRLLFCWQILFKKKEILKNVRTYRARPRGRNYQGQRGQVGGKVPQQKTGQARKLVTLNPDKAASS
jgi:hypothetical protein